MRLKFLMDRVKEPSIDVGIFGGKEIAFEILHVVDSSQGQATTCNVGRTEQLLGMKFKSAIVPATSKM